MSSSIIEKIQKLLALSKSDNQNEATVAAATAYKLILKHNISQAELEVNGETPEEIIKGFNTPIYQTGRQIPWKVSLVNVLSKHYGCTCFVNQTYPNRRKFSTFVLVGRISDIEAAVYMFSWLSTKIQDLSDVFCKGQGKIFAQSYCAGFVAGVDEQMNKAKVELRLGVSSSALMVLDNKVAEADKFMRSTTNLDTRKQPASKVKVKVDAYGAGRSHGTQINLGLKNPHKMLGNS
jgi:hypothetical protein